MHPAFVVICDCKPFVWSSVSPSLRVCAQANRTQIIIGTRPLIRPRTTVAFCSLLRLFFAQNNVANGICHCSSRRLQFPTYASCLRKTYSETTAVLCQLLGLYAKCFLLLVRLHTHSQTWRHRRQNERLTITGHNKDTVQDSPLDTYTIKCKCSH